MNGMTPRSAVSRARIIAWALPLSLVLMACGTAEAPADSGITLVATTSILGDIAAQVVGDQGHVEVMIPIGVDSHEFQPSSRDASLISEADLVVANGLGLEQGLVDVLAAAEAQGTAVVELAPLVDPIPLQEPEADDHEDEPSGSTDEHEHEGEDPHFWMDPVRVGNAALALAAELNELYPDGAWEERAREYVGELEETDQAIEDLLASVPVDQRQMVTNHEAFGYFADRYDFEILGVVIPGGSTLAEPSSAELARLVEIMEQEGASVIFAETSQPAALAESIAAELGEDVAVVELYTESLGLPGSGAETLPDMLFTNAGRITEALG